MPYDTVDQTYVNSFKSGYLQFIKDGIAKGSNEGSNTKTVDRALELAKGSGDLSRLFDSFNTPKTRDSSSFENELQNAGSLHAYMTPIMEALKIELLEDNGTLNESVKEAIGVDTYSNIVDGVATRNKLSTLESEQLIAQELMKGIILNYERNLGLSNEPTIVAKFGQYTKQYLAGEMLQDLTSEQLTEKVDDLIKLLNDSYQELEKIQRSLKEGSEEKEALSALNSKTEDLFQTLSQIKDERFYSHLDEENKLIKMNEDYRGGINNFKESLNSQILKKAPIKAQSIFNRIFNFITTGTIYSKEERIANKQELLQRSVMTSEELQEFKNKHRDVKEIHEGKNLPDNDSSPITARPGYGRRSDSSE